MGSLEELKDFLDNYETAPRFKEMPRLTLSDKGSSGPTGAHFIEEIYTPYNLAYISVTTGSTAFQNIVGVTRNELKLRIAAGKKALELSGLSRGDKLLVTYPPLVNVFYKDALEDYEYFFLERSCRNALLWALCSEKPGAVIGESSFLRASLEDAVRLNLLDELSNDTIFLAAGTPLDLDLLAIVDKYNLGEVHDLYGCQEYGWLTLDGSELREDICLIPSSGKEGYFHLIVGGLPTGDCFPVTANGHICAAGRMVSCVNNNSNLSDHYAPTCTGIARNNNIITYSRLRTKTEPEVTITHTTAGSEDTIYRLAKTILRIKGKVLRVSPELITRAAETIVIYNSPEDKTIRIKGPGKTMLIDALLDAQMQYQSIDKKDPVWLKTR